MNTRLLTRQRNEPSSLSFFSTQSFKAQDMSFRSSLWTRVSFRFSFFSAMWVSHCPSLSEGGTDADCTSPLSCCAKGAPFLGFSSFENGNGYGSDTGLMLYGTNELIPVCWVIVSVNMIPPYPFRYSTNTDSHTLLAHFLDTVSIDLSTPHY